MLRADRPIRSIVAHLLNRTTRTASCAFTSLPRRSTPLVLPYIASQSRAMSTELTLLSGSTVAPYSPAVTANGFMYVSGQVGIDANLKKVEGGFEAEVKQVLANLKSVIERGGGKLDRVVKCTVFLTDMSNFGKLNEHYAAFFGSHKPARSAFAVKELPLGCLVEIEAVVAM
ncbi:Endoribonuclease L-PSP/chorismate mutase-like protein [Hyaloraphidium curvatum]|nr:Endoribonuclease L-PSP/chorismate mutase-like protein [Hyaloraphidium curvatum]